MEVVKSEVQGVKVGSQNKKAIQSLSKKAGLPPPKPGDILFTHLPPRKGKRFYLTATEWTAQCPNGDPIGELPPETSFGPVITSCIVTIPRESKAARKSMTSEFLYWSPLH